MKKLLTVLLIAMLAALAAPATGSAQYVHPVTAMWDCDSYYDAGLRSRQMQLAAGWNVSQAGPLYVDSYKYAANDVAVRFKYNTGSPYTSYFDCRLVMGMSGPTFRMLAGQGLVLTSDLPTNPQVENPWPEPSGY